MTVTDVPHRRAGRPGRRRAGRRRRHDLRVGPGHRRCPTGACCGTTRPSGCSTGRRRSGAGWPTTAVATSSRWWRSSACRPRAWPWPRCSSGWRAPRPPIWSASPAPRAPRRLLEGGAGAPRHRRRRPLPTTTLDQVDEPAPVVGAVRLAPGVTLVVDAAHPSPPTSPPPAGRRRPRPRPPPRPRPAAPKES